ncbi:MAG: replication factor C small subunit [Candidatus Altarchaeaceae archaeon]
MELPWTEKYRPKFLDEIVGQENIVKRLKSYVKERNLPHMLFAGPAGTGKTTASLCLARELFGEDFKRDFIELNASDERGIDVVRGKIKEFARTLPIVGDFKIIFLDEADALTPEAQHALRRTMEQFTKTCRFILSCNYSSKIIEPIQSRCAIFRFKRIPKTEIKKKLIEILKKENVEYEDSGIDAIIDISGGDMRHAINILQSCAAYGKITEENVYEISSMAKPEDIRKILELALNGKFVDARNYVDNLILNLGISGEDILLQMNKETLFLNTDDRTKMSIIDIIGECNFRLVEGANERIQLEALLAKIGMLKINEKQK